MAINTLHTFHSRKADIRRESMSIQRKMQQRIQKKADELSRLARARASAELANEALHAVIRLAYETLADGSPVNVDSVTGDLLIPAPWSSRNYHLYGLRRSESDVLRGYMLRLQELAARGKAAPPLFTYDAVSHRWTLNRVDYPTLQVAETWLTRHQLTGEVWLKWMRHLRKQRRKWRAK